MTALWYVLAWCAAFGFLIFGAAALGAGVIHLSVAKTIRQRRENARAAGQPWHGAEVWLVVAILTVWFAFPGLGRIGANFSHLATIFCVALLVRTGIAAARPSMPERPPALAGVADGLLWLASVAMAGSIGLVLAPFLRGAAIDSSGDLSLPLFAGLAPSPPDYAIFDWYSVLLAMVAGTSLAMHGALWIRLRAAGVVRERARVLAAVLSPVVLLLFTAGAIVTGYVRADPETQPSSLLLVAGALLSLTACLAMQWRGRPKIAYACSTMFLVGSAAAIALLLNPNFLPSTISPAYTFRIENLIAPEDVLRRASLPWFAAATLLLLVSISMHARLWRGTLEE